MKLMQTCAALAIALSLTACVDPPSQKTRFVECTTDDGVTKTTTVNYPFIQYKYGAYLMYSGGRQIASYTPRPGETCRIVKR